MDIDSTIKKIQDAKLLISKNRIEDSLREIEQLAEIFKDAKASNELVLLSADYHQYNTEVRHGRISVFNETRNRVINSCLELVNQFEKEIIETSLQEQFIKEQRQVEQSSSKLNNDDNFEKLSDYHVNLILENNSFNSWLTLICLVLANENKTVISEAKIANLIDSSEDYVRAYLIPLHSLKLYSYKEVKSEGNWMKVIEHVDPRISNQVEGKFLEVVNIENKKHGDMLDYLLNDLERVKKYFKEN